MTTTATAILNRDETIALDREIEATARATEPITTRAAARIVRDAIAEYCGHRAPDLAIMCAPAITSASARKKGRANFRTRPQPTIRMYGKRNVTRGIALHEAAHAIRHYQGIGADAIQCGGHDGEWAAIYRALARRHGLIPHAA